MQPRNQDRPQTPARASTSRLSNYAVAQAEHRDGAFSQPKPSYTSTRSRTDSAVKQSGEYVRHSAAAAAAAAAVAQRAAMPRNSTTAGPSLATHYMPEKLVSTPSSWGAEARKESRRATGGLGAAAGRSGRQSAQGGLITSSSSGNIASQANANANAAATTPTATTTGLPRSVSGADLRAAGWTADSTVRVRKWGAGRRAWGADGGGHAVLGAGGYESDEGVDLDDAAPVQEHDNPSSSSAAVGIPASESRFEPKRSRLSIGGERTESPGSQSLSNSDEMISDRQHRRRSLLTRVTGVALPSRKSGRWNQFKWVMFAANFVLTCYAIAGFVALLLTWANYFPRSNALLVVNRTEIVLGTIAMALCLITAIIGWTGILLNNRAFLAVYGFMLWVALAFIVAPGYIAYKQRTFNLAGKMNHLWSRELSLSQRRMLQTVLSCCGYYSPFIEAAADGNRCYARSSLPGCKAPLIEFERSALLNVYAIAFALVPAHLACVIATMLCANHITYRFGKGVTPARYRVDDQTLRVALQKKTAAAAANDNVVLAPGQHVLYADQTPLDEPRPRFWHDASSLSSSSGKAKS